MKSKTTITTETWQTLRVTKLTSESAGEAVNKVPDRQEELPSDVDDERVSEPLQIASGSEIRSDSV